jgi:Domain of unknown function (DUF4410)
MMPKGLLLRNQHMRVFGPILMLACVAMGVAAYASTASKNSAAQQPITPPPLDKSKITVYVSDFELHAQPRRTDGSSPRRTSAHNTSSSAKQANPAGSAQEPDNPVQQAHAITDLLSVNILAALQKNGYQAVRLPAGRPSQGVTLRGVFAEADELNHIRRVILGSGSQSPTFLLYVTAQNLAKPDQAFYQLVDPSTPGVTPEEFRYGPIITLTSYAPLSKYELSKEPTSDDIKKVAGEIAVGLDTLLHKNPAALSE